MVVGYNTHHSKDNVSFYCFLNPVDDVERYHKWISFVSRKNKSGTPWEPQDGKRLCSQPFISGKKSNSVTSPDYVPSIYLKKAEKKATNLTAVDSLARFECAQRHLNKLE